MMRFCALALLVAAAFADKSEWSQPIKEADSRTDWIPVPRPRDLDVAAQEQVSTILRPPSEQSFLFQQGPRQIRTNFNGFPRDQQTPFRFPGQPPALNGPPPRFIPNLRNAPPPPFLQQGPPQFINQPQIQVPAKPQSQNASDEEVQLVYVPVNALPPFQGQSNIVPIQQRPPQDFQAQFNRNPSPPPFANQQQQFEQQSRIAAQKDQEERKRIQDEDFKRREEQEKKIRQELDQKKIQQQQQRQQAPQNLQSQENLFQQRFPQPAELPKNQPTPHQPPLAVYLTGGRPAATSRLTVEDVLETLKDATSIPVLDQLPDNLSAPPQIFVGPAEMPPPEGYAKFNLPYLNSLDTNRVERKVEQFPFFVAPLSYSPPQGYNKIPFPAPHVGSVVFGPAARHFESAPPAPVQEPQQFGGQEISPAIPLLVNSLQSERKRPQAPPQQQQQVAPVAPPQPPPIFNTPLRHQPPPQRIQPQPQPQFIYQDEQSFAPQPQPQQIFPAQQQLFSPPPPQQNFNRQHHRQQQHHRPAQQHQPQQHVEQFIHQTVTPADQVQPQQHHFFEQDAQEIPQRQQFTPQPQVVPQRQHHFTPQPQFIQNQQFQFAQEEEEPAVVTEQQVINEVETTTTTTTTTEAPQTTRHVPRVRNHQRVTPVPAVREENVERRPVNRGRRPVARQRTTTTTPEPEVVEQVEVEEQPELQRTPAQALPLQTEAPTPNYPQPTQISTFNDFQNFAQIPARQQNFDARPQFPTYQFENAFRTQPAQPPAYVEQNAVFPEEPVVEASPSPLDYQSASPQVPVRQFSSTPFAPTALPEYYTQFTTTTLAPEIETTTKEVVTEAPSTTVEPQRTRQRVVVPANTVAADRPRGRVRQRVRVTPSEEGETENVPQNNSQRTRHRQLVRVRTTTEAPEGAEVEREAPRTSRFRNNDRTRARQQVVRGQQEDLELAKPVRQGQSNRVANESPVFVPENEEATTVKQDPTTTVAPARRFKNFGVAQRRRVKPAVTQEAESTPTNPPPAARGSALRSSRRQQTPSSPLDRPGRLLRKPVKTEEEPQLDTGVTYAKIVEAPVEEVAKEEVVEEAPVPQRVRVSASRPRQNYPENFREDEPYRPRQRVAQRNRFYPEEDSEFRVEESQRSEQISVQQLDDSVNLLKEYYQKYNDEHPVEEISFTEEPYSTDAPTTDEIFSQQEEQEGTTDAVPTTIVDEVPEPTVSSTEQPKFSAKIKVNSVKRRIRLKKRPLAEVFDAAESQNIAAANLNKNLEKDEETSKLSSLEEKQEVVLRTTSTTTPEPVTSEVSAESTSFAPEEEVTTLDSTTMMDEEATTTESYIPSGRIIGTSTTTEISLETEICYKGRCIKTKGDTDQVVDE
ncbi:titin [Neocloeon triangulifer]|uniref:titin n=1 Tax=Neocloeon triangulifer TaxID=2078957 RepID=UPI00286F6E60|nr:titin [Neocloeon triangulifer]